ncbi:MAG: TrkH family potassium uptake protein [Treponema sp.]
MIGYLSVQAFILSLIILFLQQWYHFPLVSFLIQAMDIAILLLVVIETLRPLRQERYIKKYLQNNAPHCISTVLFCIVFFILKTKIRTAADPQELTLIFAVFKSIFLLGKIVKQVSTSESGRQKIMLNPAGTLLFSFLVMIITGSFLLMLPAASTGKYPLDFLTALFTAASAVCVTGLSVIDVSVALTPVGKTILILLIQIGGLGIMVFSFFGMLAFRRKLSVADKITVSYMVSEDDMSALFKSLRVIVFSTFFIEAVSAAFLYVGFAQIMGQGQITVYYALFHAISAFCNAGFALFSNNLESFTANPIISLTIAGTIILGGISFAVINEVTKKLSRQIQKTVFKKKVPPFFFSLNTYIVLTMTGTVLLISFICFYLLEHAHTMKDFPLGTQYLAAFFQAVTLRTAGFSTVSFASLTNTTLLFMIFIMFLGGASGSTAGGIKLNTVAVVFAFFKSFLKNRNAVTIKKNAIPDEQVKKAFLIFGFGFSVICMSIFILTMTETIAFLPLFFETVSAFATVGLSTGITAALSVSGKLVIIFLMFIGRVGPLTILTAAGKKRKEDTFEYPYGTITIG